MGAMPNNSVSSRYRMRVKARAAITTWVVFTVPQAITIEKAST
jgi:hypothetical protein